MKDAAPEGLYDQREVVTASSEMHPRSGLFFGLLGPLAVWRDGVSLELGTPQQRRVLALLLLRRNEVVSTDQLVEALWGGDPPPDAIPTVRNYVSRLRDCLEESAFVTQPGGYMLAVAAAGTDVDLFQELLVAGRAALDAGEAARAESELRRALALVRDRPLAGFEYDDFCRYEVERLEELRLLAHEDLVESRLAQGEHRELVSELRAATVEHSLRERFWAQLMLSLYRSGRQVEALEAYRQARDLLEDGLGLQPSRELRTLERMILLQERTLDHGAVGRLHGVPTYQTSFVGRGEAVESIRTHLRRERLVTLVGAAGIGKTRLAAEAATSLRDAFPDGIWWVDLSSADANRAPAAFARSLSVRELPGRVGEDLVVARLRGARILLIVDNCEHVAQPVGRLALRLLSETDSTRILATSREPLRVGGERVHQVPSLTVPPGDAIGPDSLMEFEAARLFVARVAAAGVRLRLDERDAATIAHVVARLDGLPLAIELAAGKLRSLSLSELAGWLDGLLADGERTGPARHRTLDAAIAWSYELLTPEERDVFLALAVFPGSFDAPAAEAVARSGLSRARFSSC